MKTTKAIFLCIGAAALIISCKKEVLLQEKKLDSDKLQTLYEVFYWDKTRTYMDIALPKNRTTNTPVVIFIHGGAWVMGSKEIFYPEIKKFAEAGIACATINYTYASKMKNNHHAELVADIRKAIDFIASKSETYQVSPDRFGLVGQSAGGHLALITSYTMNYDNKIKACASWAGPVDFIDQDQLNITGAHAISKIYIGCELNTANDTFKYKEASPFWMVNSTSVPTLLIHGTEDIGVPYCNIVKMQAKLESFGVVNQFKTFEGGAHLWTGGNLADARNTTLGWFQSKL